MRVFSVSAPDSISLIFTKFMDIGGVHAGKRVKIGRREMCSASGHVLQMPLWASTRRSERFLSTRREEMQAAHFCMEAHGMLTGQLSEIRTVVCVCGKTQ